MITATVRASTYAVNVMGKVKWLALSAMGKRRRNAVSVMGMGIFQIAILAIVQARRRVVNAEGRVGFARSARHVEGVGGFKRNEKMFAESVMAVGKCGMGELGLMVGELNTLVQVVVEADICQDIAKKHARIVVGMVVAHMR